MDLYIEVMFFYYSLQKSVTTRPNYVELLQHSFIKRGEEKQGELADYVKSVFQKYGNPNAESIERS